MQDWKAELTKAVIVRQHLRDADRQRLWQYPLPRVAASPEAIAAYEERMGRPLHGQYKDFLSYADGWPSFYQDVSLLGTQDGESELADRAAEQLQVLDAEGALGALGANAGEVVTLAVSLVQPDMFVTGVPGSSLGEQVVWLAGYEIERYPNFDEFFLAMVDYQRKQLSDFQAQQK